jgi:hypothetical protein
VQLRFALFGEAQKGKFHTPTECPSLMDLYEQFGEPPSDTQGIGQAIQSILMDRYVVYTRVHEEGFSMSEYQIGLKKLEDRKKIPRIHALCLPGVGDPKIIDSASLFLKKHKAVLLTSEKDAYDYFTSLETD